jgi:hypothetical protein
MRTLIFSTLAVLLMCLGSVFCEGQCTADWNEQSFPCNGPQGCQSEVTLVIPMGGQYGVTVICGATSCCGQLFTTCPAGGNCQPTTLKRPEVQKQLVELALVSDVLVEDCAGHYVLYEPSPPENTPKRDWIFAVDHRLR